MATHTMTEMWQTVLPSLQMEADLHGIGVQWKAMRDAQERGNVYAAWAAMLAAEAASRKAAMEAEQKNAALASVAAEAAKSVLEEIASTGSAMERRLFAAAAAYAYEAAKFADEAGAVVRLRAEQRAAHKAMPYAVQTFRDAGLEAKWSKNSAGAPIIIARKPGGRFYYADRKMWETAQKVGVAEAFDRHTALGDYFSA